MHRRLGLQEWVTVSPCLLCLIQLLPSPYLSSLDSPNHHWFTLPLTHILTHRTHPPICSMVPVPPMPISVVVELFIMALPDHGNILPIILPASRLPLLHSSVTATQLLKVPFASCQACGLLSTASLIGDTRDLCVLNSLLHTCTLTFAHLNYI